MILIIFVINASINQHTPLNEAFWAMLEYEDDYYSSSDLMVALNAMSTINAEFARIETMIQEGDFSSAFQRALAIEYDVLLMKGNERDYSVYMDWLNLQKVMNVEGRTWSEMNENDLAVLGQIAEKFDTYAGVQAQAVLNEYAETDFFVPPAFGKAGEERSKNVEKAVIADMIKVYPLPANEFVYFELPSELPLSEGKFYLYDLNGRVVKTLSIGDQNKMVVLNTKYLAEGMYLYEIKGRNALLTFHGKLEVMH